MTRLSNRVTPTLRPSSVSRGVFLIFLLLITPFYLMSLAAYARGSHEVKQRIIGNGRTEITNTLLILENEISHIRKTQSDLIQDKSLNELAYFSEGKENYDIMLLRRDLRERLGYIQSDSTYVKDVSVYLFASGIKVSGRDGISEITESDRRVIKDFWEKRSTQLAALQDGLYMGLFYPFYDVETQFSEYSIIVEFDTEAINKFINKNAFFYNGRTILKFMSGDMIIGDSDSDEAKQILSDALSRDNYISGDGSFKYEGKNYIVVYQYSLALDALMVNYISETSAFQSLSFYKNWMMAFIAIIIAVILSFSYTTYVIIHRPLKRLYDAFSQIAGGRLDIEIEHKASDEFKYIYEHFNDMVATINRLIREMYEQKILAQQAELKQLQSKINPHFLYNTFFSIATTAKAEGSDITYELAHKTGKYFRYVMKNASERVTLKNELDYAKLYAEIQELRFSNRLTVKFNDPPDTEAYLPAFCIQPLIENAIAHGLELNTGGKVIIVGFEERSEGLELFVEDNGGGITKEKIEQIQKNLSNTDDALANISRRLEITFGRSDCLKFSVGKDNGLRVEILIPNNI
ncbi:MAG: histidine kinase [Clostridiales bacterium]|jgi:two-component system sensor histidine kinase YesM|nr:histidine kinase [Clostridiales bacterium]